MRDFDMELKMLRNQITVVEKEQEEFENKFVTDSLIILKKLPIDKFLNLIEACVTERKVENPTTPNQLEVDKIYKVLKGTL